MAAGALLAVVALGGLAVAALAGGGSKKKKDGSAPPMHEIEGADAQMGALYSRLMDPSKTNLVELEQGAAILKGNGHHDWAGNVYSKISSLRAAESMAAQSAAAAKAAAAAAAAAAKAAGDAKADAKKREWEQAYGGTPSPEMLTKTFLAAMDPSLTDIGQMQYAAAVLQAYGRAGEAAQVRARIAKLEGEGTADVGTSVATKAPGGAAVIIDDGMRQTPEAVEDDDEDTGAEADDDDDDAPTPPPPPIAEEETKPQADPIGTIRLARNLIAAEEKSNWKGALKADVQTWQGKAGLTADGMFGPKSALRMGEEVGILPRVRYWSKTGGTKTQQVDRYRTALNALADRLEARDPRMRAHANALRISAANENGQGYPAAPAKQPQATANAKLAADVVSTDVNKDELRELLKLGPDGLQAYYDRQAAAREALGEA